MPAMRKDDDWVQRRVFLFSHPRTASNLFLRMLSAQSEWQISTYHYLEGFQYLREALQDAKDISSLKADAKTQCETLSRRAAEKMQASLDVAASQGKHCLIKEHAFMVSPLLDMKRHEDLRAGLKPTTQSSQQKNPTVFSDQEMFSWQPVILIRNPIAVYESWLKVEGSPYPDLHSAIGQIYTTLTHQRRIFDWYQQISKNDNKAILPIIIDADDLIDKPEILYKLCDFIGMSREELVFQWDAKPRLENPSDRMKRIEHFHSTIWGSTGIDQSKTARHLDLKIKEAEWAATFGIEQAKVLVERVKRSWPDYEHLKAHKLC